jgi:predicted nucleic acid-binding protein
VIVIDASAVVEMCLGTPLGKVISQSILESDEDLIAPELLPLEVIHALRRQRNLKLITDAEANEAFKLFCLMPIQHLSHAELVQRVWQLRNNMTAYDATYVALAEKLSAPIWATDGKYQNTPQHNATTRLFTPAP